MSGDVAAFFSVPAAAKTKAKSAPPIPAVPARLPGLEGFAVPDASRVVPDARMKQEKTESTAVALIARALDDNAAQPVPRAADVAARLASATRIAARPVSTENGRGTLASSVKSPGVQGLLGEWDRLVDALDSVSLACSKQACENPREPLGKILRQTRREGGYSWGPPTKHDYELDLESLACESGNSATSSRAELLQRCLDECRIDLDGNVIDKSGLLLGRIGSSVEGGRIFDGSGRSIENVGSQVLSVPRTGATRGPAAWTVLQFAVAKTDKEAFANLVDAIFKVWRSLSFTARKEAEKTCLVGEVAIMNEQSTKLYRKQIAMAAGWHVCSLRRSSFETAQEAFAHWRHHVSSSFMDRCAEELHQAQGEALTQREAEKPELTLEKVDESNQIDNLTEQLINEKELEQLRAALARSESDISAANARLDEQGRALEESRKTASLAHADLQDKVEELKIYSRELEAAQVEVSSARAKADTANKATTAVRQEMAGVRRELLAAQGALEAAREDARRAKAEAKLAECQLWEFRKSGTESRPTPDRSDEVSNEHSSHDLPERALLSQSSSLGLGRSLSVGSVSSLAASSTDGLGAGRSEQLSSSSREAFAKRRAKWAPGWK